MKTQIVINITLEDDSASDATIRAVLLAALSEYVNPRTPVDRYVATHYANAPEAIKDAKIREVTERVRLAKRLGRAAEEVVVQRFETLDD